MSDPEWLVTGGRAVILVHDRMMNTRVHDVTIERVLKRDVVLSNGERFNRQRLSRSRDTWGPTSYLVAPDDPRVARARRVQEIRRAKGAVEHVYGLWSKGKAEPGDVIAALTRLIEIEAEEA